MKSKEIDYTEELKVFFLCKKEKGIILTGEKNLNM